MKRYSSFESLGNNKISHAVAELSKLPGVGKKTALRWILWLLSRNEKDTEALSESLRIARHDVHECTICGMWCEQEICGICEDKERDRGILCVVENIESVLALEGTGLYGGVYHILGGVINPVEGIGPDKLRINSLLSRVANEKVSELIFALAPTIEGDTTCLYLSRRIEEIQDEKKTVIQKSVLARGVGVGEELIYTDEQTLGRALVERREWNE